MSNSRPNGYSDAAISGIHSGNPSSLNGSTVLDPSDFPVLGTSISQNPSYVNSTTSPDGRPPPGLQSRAVGGSGVSSDAVLTASTLLPGSDSRDSHDPRHENDETSLSHQTDHPSPDSKDLTDMDRYGMNGLLGVIRMENNDQTTVAIGNDLTSQGLNMRPDSPLSKTFASPWIETSRVPVEPEFKLPSCYDVPSAVPQQQKIQSLSDESLFYIFYTMPRDTMQEASAVELTNRNWRYHKDLKLWLTKDPQSEPIQQTAQAERGIYIFFDPSKWEKVRKEYVLYYPSIA